MNLNLSIRGRTFSRVWYMVGSAEERMEREDGEKCSVKGGIDWEEAKIVTRGHGLRQTKEREGIE